MLAKLVRAHVSQDRTVNAAERRFKIENSEDVDGDADSSTVNPCNSSLFENRPKNSDRSVLVISVWDELLEWSMGVQTMFNVDGAQAHLQAVVGHQGPVIPVVA